MLSLQGSIYTDMALHTSPEWTRKLNYGLVPTIMQLPQVASFRSLKVNHIGRQS